MAETFLPKMVHLQNSLKEYPLNTPDQATYLTHSLQLILPVMQGLGKLSERLAFGPEAQIVALTQKKQELVSTLHVIVEVLSRL